MVKKIGPSAIGPDDVTDVTAKPDPLAGLDSLEREALGAEQAGQAEQKRKFDKEAQQETDTMADDLADALGMAASVARPAMWWLDDSQFEQLWGRAVRKGIAENGAEIMRRHGLSMGDMLSKYGPYIGLAGALGPSALATVAAYKHKKREMIAAQGGGDAT